MYDFDLFECNRVKVTYKQEHPMQGLQQLLLEASKSKRGITMSKKI